MIHSLDAAFSYFVIEDLHAHGLRDIVNVHDCWLVAADAQPQLGTAIRDAGAPWFLGLGTVYDWMLGYLEDPDPRNDELAGWVRGWKRKWEERCDEARRDPRRWPVFRCEPSGAGVTRDGHRLGAEDAFWVRFAREVQRDVYEGDVAQ